MGLTTGDYRIHSCYNIKEGRRNVLNLDSGKVTNGTRIYTTKPDGTREQIWYYNKNRLYTEAQDSKYRNTKCLDRLNTSANYADIYDDNDDVNQKLIFEEVDSNKSIYRIRLLSKINNQVLYLTTTSASSTASSCYWTTLKTDDSQKWIFERLIRVCPMPAGTFLKDYYGENLIEYFSGCTSWEDGGFHTQRRAVRELVKKLYRAVSHDSTGSLADDYCLYNLPGALACGQGEMYDGYFHYGIDMQFSGSVYPYKDGIYFGESAGDGAVGIKHSFPQGDYVFWYLHMNKRFVGTEGEPISKDTCIGQVGSVGAAGQHLHIEVQKITEEYPRSPRDNNVYVNEDNDGYFGAYNLLDFIA